MQEKVKEIGKKALKAALSVLILSLALTILVKIADGLYDYRLILGVIAGKVGYDKLYKAIEEVTGLK